MKIFKSLFLAAALFTSFLSCQKELSFNNGGVSSGTLKKDAGGDCLPVTVNGIFKKDSVLTDANFVDVQVNVLEPGNFEIKSDTINGYSFRKVGTVVFGINTIRLYASGKPTATGTNIFTIKYGASTCKFAIPIAASVAGTAVYVLGSTSGVCSGATVGGTYTVGTLLTSANTLTVEVNVSTVGTYLLTAASTGGFVFGATGVFTTTGLQNVTLNGAGTPSTAGIKTVTVTNVASSCTYNITVQTAGGSPAVFTLNGAPNSCTNFTVNGTYNAASPVAASNTVTLNVNVTTAGSYTITTNTANGITFSKTGTFTATGGQTVVLNATGTPTAAGTFIFKPNVTSTCDFSVTVQPLQSPAQFTLSGAPACAPITVNGTYTANTVLGITNTAVVQVNVSVIGSYTLATNTVNGMAFSKSGTFTVTGLQNVTLQGSGTPLTAATSTLTPQIGASSCTFSVTVGAASSADIFQCKIAGVLNTFTDLADGVYPQLGDLLISGGKLYSSFPDEFILEIDKSSTGGTVTTGTYVNTLAGSIAGGYILSAVYTDGSNAHWAPASIFATTPDPFTIIITSLTATRVVGTFSGTVRDNFGAGTNTKIITEGVFNLPIK